MTIAFDLDGTLVDTAPDLIGVLNVMLGARGLPEVPLSAARHLVGRGARFLLEHGFSEAGAPFQADEAPGMVDRFVELYLGRIAQESRPFPGMIEALDLLEAQGARFCICTNKRTNLSVALVKALRLEHRFAAVVGPDLVTKCKPSGAHLIEAVRMSGGDPTRAIMIGDSETDVGSARNAGVPVVVVSFGYTEIPVQDLGADVLIDHFSELPGAIGRLLGADA